MKHEDEIHLLTKLDQDFIEERKKKDAQKLLGFKRKEIAKSGIGVQIAIVVLCLVFFGVLMPVFYFVTTTLIGWKNTSPLTVGAFTGLTGTVYTFMNSWWIWWPIIGILFPLILYGILQAQKRGAEDGY